MTYMFFMYLGNVDVGECSLECPYCQAQLWYEERSDKCKRLKQVDFSLCCQKGKVQLPLFMKPPQLLQKLFKGEDSTSQHFLHYIRSYNNMFSFTSIGAKIHSSINDGSGPPEFILSGQNYHRIGSLLPEKGLMSSNFCPHLIFKFGDLIEFSMLKDWFN